MGKLTCDIVCLEHFIHSQNGSIKVIVQEYLGGNTISAGVFNWSLVNMNFHLLEAEWRTGSPFAMRKQHQL